MVVSGLMDNRADAMGLLQSRDWSQIQKRLNEYVEHVNVKVVEPQGPFQM
jgi:hypothetical protein